MSIPICFEGALVQAEAINKSLAIKKGPFLKQNTLK